MDVYNVIYYNLFALWIKEKFHIFPVNDFVRVKGIEIFKNLFL
jgi:hypothetical protein